MPLIFNRRSGARDRGIRAGPDRDQRPRIAAASWLGDTGFAAGQVLDSSTQLSREAGDSLTGVKAA